jgi:dipeptidyl aminopeptidase/acylaminoacyl peptidase
VLLDRHTGQSKEIWNPNPQLAGFNLGEASVYHWRDREGRQWTGGLVKPPDYVHGRRCPLVIQTHGFDEDEFLVDGFSTTANAARAMAARGMVVLQVQEIRVAHLTPREADVEGRDGYQAAIDQLSKEGVINPKKVGIIGWSRTGWYVLESLMTRPDLFAAATLAESTHGDLTQYWFLVDYALGPVLADAIAGGIGGRPTQAGLRTWLGKSPEFNADRIRAPILFEQNSPSALIFGWDLYAALRSQGSPVDLLYIRNGEHVLVKPLERLASGEMNVDWYDFWLNGHEDPDPAKAAQYERWRKLRVLTGRTRQRPPESPRASPPRSGGIRNK